MMKKGNYPQYNNEADFLTAAETALRQLPGRVKPPPDFASRVMARIAAEEVGPLTRPVKDVAAGAGGSGKAGSRFGGRRLTVWSRWAVAAALMLTLTGGGAYVALDGGLGGPGDPGMLAAGEGLDGSGDGPRVAPGGVAGGDAAGVDGQAGMTGEPAGVAGGPDGQPGPVGDGSAPVDGPDGTAPGISTGPEPAVKGNTGETVLLAKPKVLVRAFYRYEVAGLEPAVDVVCNAAEQLGGTMTDSSRQETQGMRLQQITLQIPGERAGELPGLLSGLGVLQEQNVDRQDITSRYQEVLDRLQVVQAEAATAPESRQAALQAKVQSLQQQLAAWDREVEQQTVVVWVETKS
ncbi:MAG: DUF4349 domain-containing protein [Heliobacteriaceae bacterium]|nr:DUF4349 domain-containing protein [Heliobacteriaceae bacterium]